MKTDTVNQLVESHFDVEPGLVRNYRLERDPAVEAQPHEPIKLLEVNSHSIPVGLQGIYFGPDPASAIDFPCIVYDVTPEEFERIETGELALPQGVAIGECYDRAAAMELS